MIETRPLDSLAEMVQAVDLQREIWGYGEQGNSFPYPARALFALARSGGLVAGAFSGSDMVGLGVAWIGLPPNVPRRPYLHSQLVGVLKSHRRLRIAMRLKLLQRDFALECDLDLVRWTFDPLRATNARLNLARLGAVSTSYEINYYGRIRSSLGSGLDSDRLWAEWYVRSPRVANRLDSEARLKACGELPFACINPLSRSAEGSPRVLELQTDRQEESLLFEIPPDFQSLQTKDPRLAVEWQQKTRNGLRNYLARSYLLSDFIRVEDGGRCFYVLTRKPVEQVLKET